MRASLGILFRRGMKSESLKNNPTCRRFTALIVMADDLLGSGCPLDVLVFALDHLIESARSLLLNN